MEQWRHWKASGVLLWCVLSTCGCGGTADPDAGKVSAEEQFRSIADEKEQQLKSLLEAKESKLSGYKATMTDETDIQKKSEYPHVGEITFSYAITKPKGEIEFRVMSDLNVQYRFSRKAHKWEMVAYTSKNEKGSSLLAPGSARLVQQDDVVKVFQ